MACVLLGRLGGVKAPPGRAGDLRPSGRPRIIRAVRVVVSGACAGTRTRLHPTRGIMAIKRDFTLDATYRQEEGVIFLSGIQAPLTPPLAHHPPPLLPP